jgi:uncharacterized protein YjbJ (UPF0337 family)
MAGEWDKVEGTAKEAKGKVTDDKTTQAEGRAQETWGEGKDKASQAKDVTDDKFGEGREEARERT